MAEKINSLRIIIGIADGTSIKAPTKTMTLVGGEWADVEYLFDLVEGAIEERNTEIKAEYVHETFPDATDNEFNDAYADADKNAPVLKRL